MQNQILETQLTEISFNNLKIYEKLLLLSIIVSPWRCYGVIIGGFNFSFFRIIGCLMIFTFIVFNLKVKINQVSKILIVIFFISLVQVFYSPSISGSDSNFFSFTFGYLWVFFAYSIIFQKPQLKLKLIDFMIYSSFAPIFLGLYQWSVYKIQGSIPALPFQFFVVSEGKTGITYNIFARITSCFGDPAYFTTFIVAIFALCLQSLISSKKNKGATYFLYLLLIILCIIETLMAISVSGLVGMAAAIILLILLNFRRKRDFGRFIIVTCIVLLLLGIYFFFNNYELLDILVFKLNTSSQSLENYYGRNEYIFNALDVFLANPILGGGFGSLSLNGLTFSSAHSSLLTVLGQQGIFIFILNIYILFVLPAVFLYNVKLQSDNTYSKKTLISLYSILFLTLAYDTLYSLDFCYAVIVAALASGLYLEKKNLYEVH